MHYIRHMPSVLRGSKPRGNKMTATNTRNSTATMIAARYDGERNICATYEDEEGFWHDAWFMLGEERTPAEAISLADEDEAALGAA